ncbi:UDP-N-acetylenolpyruvoylglucosamine reductase [Veronia nyctiphanis]|uniref:UDP-N-acetylenolpyruvoylglucosamine reductase n=1 Tax=Veronia nyctiphanis TaxID=1278244 RepID=A0A4Q0YPC3_9GAMM|nr:UDP-N-acetylmuramate dehydrogenase [Veronia nyctiphanis]RXJ72383.1 UDP-N-acetylenolpyruvoylglucosamine reductase [Veronia nyctiphanis]
MKTLSDTSLKSFHTFGLDVHAKSVIEADSIDDLKMLWLDAEYKDLPKLMLGEGSNLLFCESFDGLVVLNRLKGIQVTEDDNFWYLDVAAGENWHQLVKWTLDNGMPGLENLALIPGLTGSAPIQNIGAYGVELKSVCQYVNVLMVESGEVKRLSADECFFGYRDSVFKHTLKEKALIVGVGLLLRKDWQPETSYGALSSLAESGEVTPQRLFERVCEIRSSKLPDPRRIGNAGSFFKNPVVSIEKADELAQLYVEMPRYAAGNGFAKLAAGWLIDQVGLKGQTVGGASVHNKQALVLTNSNNATPADVVALAHQVVQTVRDQFGVELEHEVRFIGKNGETTLEQVCPQ